MIFFYFFSKCRNVYIILLQTAKKKTSNLHVIFFQISMYSVFCWLNIVHQVHISHCSNKAHCLQKKTIVFFFDTVQYIAVQLSITPESHFREDRHTTYIRKLLFVIMLYYTNGYRRLIFLSYTDSLLPKPGMFLCAHTDFTL